MDPMDKVRWWLLGIGFGWTIILTVYCIMLWYDVKVGCTDYLKLAGDAPSVQRANEFLGKALSYMESHNLTSGNSAILFPTPTSDVGIWYSQTKGAKETLDALLEREKSGSVSQLERDNALMKIREVVLDSGKEGTEVTHPPQINWYPHQKLITIEWIIAPILLIVCGIWCLNKIGD